MKMPPVVFVMRSGSGNFTQLGERFGMFAPQLEAKFTY
jgi:hypothetical protein